MSIIFVDGYCPSCLESFAYAKLDSSATVHCTFCGALVDLKKVGQGGGCSVESYKEARDWLKKNLPDLWRTKPAGLAVELGRLLDSVGNRR